MTDEHSSGPDRAHIYCSVFQPATYLSHPPELELTEGVHLAEREARIQVRPAILPERSQRC